MNKLEITCKVIEKIAIFEKMGIKFSENKINNLNYNLICFGSKNIFEKLNGINSLYITIKNEDKAKEGIAIMIKFTSEDNINENNVYK